MKEFEDQNKRVQKGVSRMGRVRRAIFVSGLYAVGTLTSSASSFPAPQERTAQVLVLKDPTPREPDLDKRFKSAAPPVKTDAARLAAFNQQRFQLIGQATAHLSKLATLLQTSLVQHQSGTSLGREAQVAGAIEELAANIYTSMAVPATRPTTHTTNRDLASETEEQKKTSLAAESRELVALTQELQTEVDKSTADTLPFGVLIKSARVRELAHALKERMRA